MKARTPFLNTRQRKRLNEEMRLQYAKIATKERDKMAARIIKVVIACLYSEFGFGVKRTARLFKAFTEKMDTSIQDEVFWEHIDQIVIDKLNLPFDRDYTERGHVYEGGEKNDNKNL
jgi:hypothetical protein